MEQQKFKEKMASFPKSKIWDTATQRSVDAVRAFLHRHPQPTISYIQNESVRERPLKGHFRLQSEIFPAPDEDDIRQVMFSAIDSLRKIEYERPALASVPVEWISNTAMGCKYDFTILHVHGGAFLYVRCQCLVPVRVADVV